MDPRSLPDQPAAAAQDHTPAAFYEVAHTPAGWELHCGRCGTIIATSANTPDQTDQLATAHRCPPAELTSIPVARCGPYQQPPRGLFVAVAQRQVLLHAALEGVELGALDHRIIGWLAHYCDTPAFLSVLGIPQRARIAAQAAPQRQAADLHHHGGTAR